LQKKRPEHLDLTKIKMPIQAYASIAHRVSGLFLAVISVVVIYALQLSLHSEQSFNYLKQCLQQPTMKILLLIVLSGLYYHFVTGIKHLIMDLGFAEEKTSSKFAAIISIIITIALLTVTGIWLW
jgi:succinate dehydrogenase / fumarate reductase cytochrome b subunit